MEDWALARQEAELKPIAPLELIHDGVESIVDLGAVLSFRGVFAPLKDPAYFSQVRVDTELGTVAWPNGADLDPDVLYSRLVPDSDDLVRF